MIHSDTIWLKIASQRKELVKRLIDQTFLNKYYITDLGLRNAHLNFRQLEITHSIENLVYFELKRRGYIVDIGKNADKEIDFIAQQNADLYYIQVSYSIADPHTRQRELSAFSNIKDGYKKIVITMDNDPYQTLENGYKKAQSIRFSYPRRLFENDLTRMGSLYAFGIRRAFCRPMSFGHTASCARLLPPVGRSIRLAGASRFFFKNSLTLL